MNKIKGFVAELKNVSWLTPNQTLRYTGIVLMLVIVSTLIVWGLDISLSGILSWILKGSEVIG